MDPRMPRRSPRLQEAQRPQYPQSQDQSFSQSMNTSAFHSSSSVSSISSLNTNLSQSPMSSQNGPHFSSAPLPSPSQTSQPQYFAPLQQQQQPQIQAQQQSANPFMGQQGGRGGAPETAPYLDNFNLVAEAAKRAQMACLMRDFGDVEL